MPKATVRRGKLTIPLSGEILAKVDLHDGDQLEVTSEDGRIVLTRVPEEPQPGDLEALDEAEREFAEGRTRRLDEKTEIRTVLVADITRRTSSTC